MEGFRQTDSDFNVHYDHFYKGVEMSKRYQKRDELDERTTSEVDAKARFISEMTPGETLELLRVDLFKRGRDVYMLDFMLKAIAANRLATATDSRYPDEPTKLPSGSISGSYFLWTSWKRATSMPSFTRLIHIWYQPPNTKKRR